MNVVFFDLMQINRLNNCLSQNLLYCTCIYVASHGMCTHLEKKLFVTFKTDYGVVNIQYE